MSPKVSVVVTTHNYGHYLEQCLQSVLAQTFSDFELLIVNDGSTDNTEDVLARYTSNPRVTVLPSSGIGLAAALNLGIRRSRGAYFIRLDADDYLDPRALTEEVKVLDQDPDVGLVYPDCYRVDEKGAVLGCIQMPRVQHGAHLLDDNPLAGGAMYRRRCYEALGGYNETLRYQEDYDFWLRFTEQFRAHGLGLPLLFYRQHADSMSRNRITRSAARRHVKREYTTGRDLLAKEEIAIVIPGSWPGRQERSQDLLCKSFESRSLIELAVEQAQACEWAARVIVTTNRPAVRRAALSAGAEVVPVMSLPDGRPSCDREYVEWGKELFRSHSDGRALPSLMVLASPYCPFRHPERLREIIDTLLIHDCNWVVSVEAASDTVWVRPRAVREAGELMAIRMRPSQHGSQPPESLVGYVELFYPEWWIVKDEESRLAGQELIHEAEAVRVETSTYLRQPSPMTANRHE